MKAVVSVPRGKLVDMFRRRFIQFLSLLTAAPAVVKALPAPTSPAVRRVPLVDAFIAGYQFHDGPDVEPRLRVGDALTLVRDPENTHDPQAIRLLWGDTMVGFVPRRRNDALSRLLDHGRKLEAHIVELRPDARPWERVRVVIELVS